MNAKIYADREIVATGRMRCELSLSVLFCFSISQRASRAQTRPNRNLSSRIASSRISRIIDFDNCENYIPQLLEVTLVGDATSRIKCSRNYNLTTMTHDTSHIRNARICVGSKLFNPLFIVTPFMRYILE